MSAIIFDIETGPLPEEEFLVAIPPFDPSTVKTGNLGPEKAKAKIDAARAEHEAKAVERAALSPLTGRVLAIGYLRDEGAHYLDVETEHKMLSRFWDHYRFVARREDSMVGHNIFGFDLPFLVRRSWVIGLADRMPRNIIEKNRYWSPVFVDTMVRWQLGNYREYVSLNTLAQAYGVGGKPDGVSGADFARLLTEDQERAFNYLRNDLDMTFQVALRMGII